MNLWSRLLCLPVSMEGVELSLTKLVIIQGTCFEESPGLSLVSEFRRETRQGNHFQANLDNNNILLTSNSKCVNSIATKRYGSGDILNGMGSICLEEIHYVEYSVFRSGIV